MTLRAWIDKLMGRGSKAEPPPVSLPEEDAAPTELRGEPPKEREEEADRERPSGGDPSNS